MNIDYQLVNRALNKAGEEELTAEEIEQGKSTRIRLIKNYYLSTILETLSNTAWTSQMTRERLVMSENENLSNYMYMYDLPVTCAKPVALLSEEEYLVEGRKLYTDDPDAILSFVSNHKRTTDQEEETEESDDETAEDTTEEETTEDYPDYDDMDFDPLLSQYIETKLASKIVLKLTGESGLYQLLYSEAVVMENRAVKASVAQGHSKNKGNEYWGDQLGLNS